MGERRIRITGYIVPDDDERDDASQTGLTDEAYEHYVLKFFDIEELEMEAEPPDE